MWNRIAVPIYFKTSVAIGYDSNFLKLSQQEQDNTTFDRSILGDTETYDSAVIRPELTIYYSPVIFKNDETKVRLFFANSNFSQSSNKSYNSFSIRLEQHLDSYSWLKFSYSVLPKYYLRTYYDKDILTNERIACYFSNQNIYISYSFPIMKKTWIQIKALQNNEYYNENFTEFDIEKKYGEIQINTNFFKNYKFSFWGVLGRGENANYDSGFFSTNYDRSYDFYQLGGSITHFPKQLINRVGLSVKFDRRDYQTDSPDDPLHAGRKHLDIRAGLWADKKLHDDFKIQVKWNYREKITESEFEWVEDLKSFTKHEIWLKFSYSFYADLFY